MTYLWAFVIGGLLAALAQIVMDLSKLPPGHVMVLFVVLGAIASGFGLYQPLVDLAGAGAAVPLPSFGHALVQGIIGDVAEKGWWGFISGGLTATALALTAAVVGGFVVALVFNPKG